MSKPRACRPCLSSPSGLRHMKFLPEPQSSMLQTTQ